MVANAPPTRNTANVLTAAIPAGSGLSSPSTESRRRKAKQLGSLVGFQFGDNPEYEASRLTSTGATFVPL